MRRQTEGREGFTLVEVVVSTALLFVIATGFLIMSGANASLLAREHGLDQSNYRLGSMAEEGMGEATGETMTVKFSMEDGAGGPDREAEEVFSQYIIRDQGDGTDNYMMIYRHR